jgi:hypothetical protein
MTIESVEYVYLTPEELFASDLFRYYVYDTRSIRLNAPQEEPYTWDLLQLAIL